MRKLKLQVQMSIDGFIAGPAGEMDWLTYQWSQDLIDYVNALTEPVGTILLGKNLAMGFIPHWTEALKTNEPGAQKFVETPKVVFSKSLKTSEWERTVIAGGDLRTEVEALKNEPGGDLIAYGGGQFVSSLIRENLIDELHLFVNPAVLGAGMPIFQGVNGKQAYRLIKSTPTECGIVVLTYQI